MDHDADHFLRTRRPHQQASLTVQRRLGLGDGGLTASVSSGLAAVQRTFANFGGAEPN